MIRTYGAIAAYVLRQTRLYLRRGKDPAPQGTAIAFIGGQDGPTAIFTTTRPIPRQHGTLRVPLDPRAALSALALCAGGLALLWACCRALSHAIRRNP